MAGITAFSQNLSRKITLEVHDVPLGEVIKLIGEKSEILFSYNPRSLPLDRKITFVARKTSVSRILDKVLTENGIDYTISEKQVILKPHHSQAPVPGMIEKPQQRKFTLSGYIRDKETGEAIIGANIYDKATFQGTTSNAYGFFSLSLPAGSYNITCSFMGYTPFNSPVDLDKNRESVVELEPMPVSIGEVEITTDPEEDALTAGRSGDMRLTSGALKEIPGFAGNLDVVKTLQNVPGILTFGDGSSLYYVRGGNSDQNLLMIDEAPIYNASHLFGFFSALAPNAIRDVVVYKGDFPANYGGRLSSVVDVKAKEGNLKRLGFAGNLGPFTSDLTLEGPIVKEKCSFLFSGRKSNLNWLQFSPGDKRTYNFNFYDLNAKLNTVINSNNRLFLTVFSGSDVFERLNKQINNTFGISWDNLAGTLRWNHIFNNRLFSNTTAYFSRYNYYLDIAKELRNYWNSSISNATLKTDISWFRDPGNTIKAGFEVSSHRINPGNIHYTDAVIQANLPYISEYQSVECIAYAGNEQRLSPRVIARYGLRMISWNNLGPATVYYFDAMYKVFDKQMIPENRIYKSFLNFEPRLGFRFLLHENITLNASYNHNVQHLQVVSNSTSPFTSLDVWVPAGPNIKPQQADQISLGIDGKFSQGKLAISVEGYYKKMHNQIDYPDHANLLFNPQLEGELRFGTGTAYGVETMLRKSGGKFTGWASYSFSRAMKTIRDVNNGNEFPAAYDRPHNLSVTFSYAAGRRWHLSSHWMYLTGAPFTSPTGFYYSNGYTVPLYDTKHNDRYPDYHRLDLSITFSFSRPERKFQHALVFTLYNAYGRKNPYSVNFNKVIDDNGNIVVPVNLEGDRELVPTAISVAGTIPSLNYTFSF